ncbi:MAG: TonB-dependent receptor [Candidatus Cyclobacteriaceae bacterium M3_2C_046]
MKRFILLLSLFNLFHQLHAENNLQVVKGRVMDQQSLFPLPGVSVLVVGTDPVLGAVTDADGYFRIKQVPIGRIDLKLTYVGYNEAYLPNLQVSSGKEVIVQVKMEESVEMLKDLVITASDQNKMELMNEMATVSARTFNVEETQRYAGSRNDPARMASNFAGVSGANDGRNDIIIRGNSPTGLLWRLEGMDIPNPNHFAALGTTGGPVSILNNNLLSDSEFFTGAFPAMYGNAVSGVFDLQMRNGNRDKHEFLGQLGFNGLELGAEGPFQKGSGSSYLVNYRYSLPAVFDVLGLNAGTGNAVPYYQDLSFKLNFPTKKGRLSLFGIGGISNIDLLGSETTAEEAQEDLYGDMSLDIYNKAKMGVSGLSYLRFIGKNAYWKNSMAVSYSNFTADLDTVIRDPELRVIEANDYVYNDFDQTKYTYNTLFNKKFNSRNTLTAGFIADLYQMNLQRDILIQGQERDLPNSIGFAGNTVLMQGYLAWQHKFNHQWTLNSGLHYQHLTLNENSRALEPRLGVKYQFLPNQSLSLAYGRHNQMQGMEVYFVETALPNGTIITTNKSLGFTTSNHFIASYDWMIRPNLRLKLEAYYQDISNVPVEQQPSHFSMLNAGADFGLPDTDSLVNQGTGFNQGLEFTLEKFFSQSYYFLLTGSFFEARYKGSDGIERNTAFNGNYVINALAGKEWAVGRKNNSIAVDLKFTTAGNRRYIPIDLSASQQAGYAVFDNERAFQDRFADYLRTDLKFTFRKEHKKITEEYVIDIQNVTNNQNLFSQRYNAITGTIGNTYQLGLWPIAQYRILF